MILAPNIESGGGSFECDSKLARKIDVDMSDQLSDEETVDIEHKTVPTDAEGRSNSETNSNDNPRGAEAALLDEDDMAQPERRKRVENDAESKTLSSNFVSGLPPLRPLSKNNDVRITATATQSSHHDPNPAKCVFEDAIRNREYNLTAITGLLLNGLGIEAKSYVNVTHAPEDGQNGPEGNDESTREEIEDIILDADSGASVRQPLLDGLVGVAGTSRGCIKLLLKAKSAQGLRELLIMYEEGRLAKELEKRYTEAVQKKKGNVQITVTVQLDTEDLKEKIAMLEEIENELQAKQNEEFGNGSLDISRVTFAYCENHHKWFWCEGELDTDTSLSCVWLPLSTMTYDGRRPQQKYLTIMKMLAKSTIVPQQNDHKNCIVCHEKSRIIEATAPNVPTLPTVETTPVRFEGDEKSTMQAHSIIAEVSIGTNTSLDTASTVSKVYIEEKLSKSEDPDIRSVTKQTSDAKHTLSEIGKLQQKYVDMLKPPVKGDYKQDKEMESKIVETVGDLYSFAGHIRNSSSCFVASASLYNSALLRTRNEALKNSICQSITQNERAFLTSVISTRTNLPDIEVFVDRLKNLRKEVLKQSQEIWTEVKSLYDTEHDINLLAENTIVDRTMNMSRFISADLKKIIRDMFCECHKLFEIQLCDFTLICTDTLAREEATPYTPINPIIIVPCELSDEEYQYLEQLWHTFCMMMLAFKETSLHMIGIQDLDGLDKDCGEWFYDSDCCVGFSLLSKDFNILKPPILTVSQLSSYLSEKLEDITFIHGDEQLFNDAVFRLSEVDKQKIMKQVTLDCTSLAIETVWERYYFSSPDDGCFSAINRQEVFRLSSIISTWLKATSDVTSSSIWRNLQHLSAEKQNDFLDALKVGVSIAYLLKLMYHTSEFNDNLDDERTFTVTDGVIRRFYSIMSPFLSPVTLPEKIPHECDYSNCLYKARTSLRLMKFEEGLKHLKPAEQSYQETDVKLDILLCRMEIHINLWRNLEDIHNLIESIYNLADYCTRSWSSSKLKFYLAFFCVGFGFNVSEFHGRAYDSLKQLNVLLKGNISQFAKRIIIHQTAKCCQTLGYFGEASKLLLTSEACCIPEYTARGLRLHMLCGVTAGTLLSAMQEYEADHSLVIMKRAIQVYKKYQSAKDLTTHRDAFCVSTLYVSIADALFKHGENTDANEFLMCFKKWIQHSATQDNLKRELYAIPVRLDNMDCNEAISSAYFEAAFDYGKLLLCDETRTREMFRIDYVMLVASLMNQKRVDEAVSFGEEVIEIMKECGFKDCVQYGHLSRMLGVIMFNNGGISHSLKATSYIEESLRCFNIIFRVRFDDEEVLNLEVVHCIITLGDAYTVTEKKSDAYLLFGKALGILEKGNKFSRNFKHIELLNKTASSFDDLGKAKDATKCHELSLQIIRDNFPGIYFEATVLHNLGVSYLSTDNKDKAVGFLKQAVDIFEKMKKYRQHATTFVKDYLILADLSILDKIPNQALNYLNRLLKLLESDNSNDSDMVLFSAKTYFKLGVTFSLLDDCKTAIEKIEKAIEIFRKVHGQTSNHEDITQAFQMLALIHAKNGNTDKAKSCLWQGLTMSMQELNIDENTAKALSDQLQSMKESLETLETLETQNKMFRDLLTKSLQQLDSVQNETLSTSSSEFRNMLNDVRTMKMS